MSSISVRELIGSLLPARVLDLPRPPARLFLHGELPRGPAVALVGTRKPTPEARAYTRRLAAELARAGVAVLSGGARGIDTAAHEGALEGNGSTIVVAPAGFERAYPSENQPLYASIVERGGAYLSLRAPTESATWGSFFERNAVLIALAHAVVVVEAPLQSGARNAAQHARRLARPLFIVPSPPWNVRGLGCIAELQRGARALSRARDVLRVLADQRLHPIPVPGGHTDIAACPPEVAAEDRSRIHRDRRRTPRAQALRSRNPRLRVQPEDAQEAEAVLEAVRNGASSADELVTLLGVPAKVVQRCVLMLTLQGDLAMDTAGRIVWLGPG